MSGGSYDFVMEVFGSVSAGSPRFSATFDNKYLDVHPSGPFGIKPGWSSSTDAEYFNFDICTFEYCGGMSKHEVRTIQTTTVFYQTWDSQYSSFVSSDEPWGTRGQNAAYASYSGIFGGAKETGAARTPVSSRFVLTR